MGDLKDSRLIYLKGLLFLVCGACSAMGVLLQSFELKTAVLLAITVWSFCRAYYFAFYVIENYVDDGFRFRGVWDFARYLLSGRNAR